MQKHAHTHQINKPKTQRRVLCYVRARKAARALHNTRQPTNKEKREEKRQRQEQESSVRRWRRSSR
nr:MAG TPA: hypothetical protein [Caudoviricetes sp.]